MQIDSLKKMYGMWFLSQEQGNPHSMQAKQLLSIIIARGSEVKVGIGLVRALLLLFEYGTVEKIKTYSYSKGQALYL